MMKNLRRILGYRPDGEALRAAAARSYRQYLDRMYEDRYAIRLAQLLAEGYDEATAEDEAMELARDDVEAYLYPEEAVRL